MIKTPVNDPKAWDDVINERRRQREVEGWSAEHDDGHVNGELANAAACYAHGSIDLMRRAAIGRSLRFIWPWAEQWWKPSTRRRDLVKAGALILAEIERLDRAAAKGGNGEPA